MDKSLTRRWIRNLNRAMPVVLDTTGVMLLAGSAMLLNAVAGVAAYGVALIYLNGRFYGDR